MNRLIQLLLLLSMSLLGACGMGEVEMQNAQPNVVDENGFPVDPETGAPLPPAFELSRDNGQLLPFHVRVSKLQRVTGMTQDDPAFAEIMRNRYALGDHNYGQGIGADLSWSAAKMSSWVRALKPVCASEAMATKYPSLPEHLNEFVMAAFGREVTEEDLAVVEDALAEGNVPEAQRYETTCLAVLTSMEFVGR